MFNFVFSSFGRVFRVIPLFAGLLLAACAPMTLPDEASVLRSAALQPASRGMDDGLTRTLEPTHTQIGSAGTAEPTHTPQPGMTGTLAPTPTATARAEVEFTGTVSAISGEVWTINGVRVIVTPQTEIKGNPQVGSAVKVEGRLQADGSVIAREIKALLAATRTPVAGNEIEFTGTVSAISGEVWTINGVRVIVTPQTEIKGNPQVGSAVKVEGRLQADGSVIAREIKALLAATRTPVAGNEIEFTGTVSAISGEVWTINGVRVIVTPQTEIKGNPQVGSAVKVEGRLQADGSVIAREIKALLAATRTPVAGNEIEFTGTVSAISGEVWTINGVRVTVTPQTEIKGNPQVGSAVKVEGRLQADGSVIAREIKALLAATRTPVAGNEVEFTGTVSAISGEVWTINGVRVIVTPQTEIKGNPQVGSAVKVEGRLQADGSVIAREIKALLTATRTPVAGNEVEFTGTVSAISGEVWTINGVRVIVTPQTEIKGNPQVGSAVKVEGRLQADGSVIAREIEKADSDDDHSGRGGDDDDRGGGDDDDHRGHGRGGDNDDDRSGKGKP